MGREERAERSEGSVVRSTYGTNYSEPPPTCHEDTRIIHHDTSRRTSYLFPYGTCIQSADCATFIYV